MVMGTKKKFVPRQRDYKGEEKELYTPAGESEVESLYKDISREEDRFAPKHILPPDEDEYEPEEEPEVVRVHSRETMLREDKEEIEPLRRMAPYIMGNLFDRVRFLNERIIELKDALKLRKNIHDDIVSELDLEIEEKKGMLSRLTDADDLRDLKLDISMLRGQKRREAVQFWRDNLELNTEIRTLWEQYETERKIAALFKELDEN